MADVFGNGGTEVSSLDNVLHPAEVTIPEVAGATLVMTNEIDPETIDTETFMLRPFAARLYRL